jgi:O-antigen/teichoic acid export membrane protein
MPATTLTEASDSERATVIAPKDGTGKFIRDVFFANLPLPFQKIRTYLWLVVFSKAFGPSGFGIWALFQGTLGTALILTSLTQGNAMMRFLSGDRTREEKNSAFSSVLAAVSASALLGALVLCAFSQQLSNLLFRDPRGRTVLVLTALIVPLETYFEEMRGFLRARRLNRIWAFFTLGRQMPETFMLMAVAWWWLRSPVTAITGYLCTALLAVCIGFFYLSRYQQVRLVKPSAAIIRKYVPYGAALVPGALASTLSFAADRYLVGYYLDLRQVGIYSVCFTVSAIGFFFCGPLTDVLLPEMSALYDAGDWNQFYARFSGVQKFVIGLAVGATALLVAFPQQILRALTTGAFASGGPTLAILGMQGIFMSAVVLYSVMFYVRMRVWWTTAVWAGMGVIILVMDVFLLPRMGIVGAGFSQLVSSIAGAGFVVALNWELFRRTFRIAWIAQTGLALLSVLLLGRLWPVHSSSMVEALLHILAGAATFAAASLITGYLRLDELAILYHAFARRSKPADPVLTAQGHA